MTVTCIRTGCQAYLTETGEYVYGDAFEGDDFIVINCVARERKFVHVPVRHFTIRAIAHWWNRAITSPNSPSVILAYAQQTINHGYEGVADAFLRPDGSQRVNSEPEPKDQSWNYTFRD